MRADLKNTTINNQLSDATRRMRRAEVGTSEGGKGRGSRGGVGEGCKRWKGGTGMMADCMGAKIKTQQSNYDCDMWGKMTTTTRQLKTMPTAKVGGVFHHMTSTLGGWGGQLGDASIRI